jgi:heat shock protein HspQ
MTQAQSARFSIGQVVRHREAAFRGVVLDVDAAYAGPAGQTGAVSPDQPFYSVFVREDDGGGFVAYAAQDALLDDPDVLSPEDARRWFTIDAAGHHAPLDMRLH